MKLHSSHGLPLVRVLLVAGLLAAGCRDFHLGAPEEPDLRIAGDIEARLAVPFELAIGQAARLDAQRLVVRFLAVGEDSRCPRATDCLEAGLVGAVFEVERDDGSSSAFQLWVPGLIDEPWMRGDLFQSGQERFRLLWVDPYPQDGVEIAAEEWRATLRVDHDL